MLIWKRIGDWPSEVRCFIKHPVRELSKMISTKTIILPEPMPRASNSSGGEFCEHLILD